MKNAYFLHPENILLSMITAENVTVRKLGWCKFLKVRTVSSSNNGVRNFKITNINTEALNYNYEAIDWQSVEVTEPPSIMSMGIEQIIAFRDSGEIWQAPKLPCHTQAVERMIKVVAEPSLCVAGLEERWICNE